MTRTIRSRLTRVATLLTALLWGLSLGGCATKQVHGLGAEDPVQGGAVQAFHEYMAAMNANDWGAASRMMHPEALDEFHRVFVALSAADTSGEVSQMFFGVQSAEEVKALSPEIAFEKVMVGMIASQPGMDQIFRDADYTFLGTVDEGEVVHVVYRMHIGIGESRISKIAVSPFQPEGDGWGALLTGDLEGMIHQLKAELGTLLE